MKATHKKRKRERQTTHQKAQQERKQQALEAALAAAGDSPNKLREKMHELGYYLTAKGTWRPIDKPDPSKEKQVTKRGSKKELIE